MKTKLLLLMTGLAFTLSTKAYTSLRVQDPHETWKYGQGTIDSAVLSIQPKGAYFEYGLYLTFSAKGLSSSYNKDSFEVQMQFDLPEGAIVTDSWLWIGNNIMQALIMDRGRASMIYEGIVKRRQDPSILFKNSSTQYELRVYPMAYNETRKVKLTYLVPAQWGLNSVQAAIPINILKASQNPPTFRVLAYADNTWKNPRIPELSWMTFSSPPGLPYQTAILTYPSYSSLYALSFSMASPFQNGIFVSKYATGLDEGYYQIAMIPSKLLSLNGYKKAALLFDYEPGMSNTTAQEVLDKTRQMLHEYFSPKDSFNLILSHLNILRASPRWIACDSASIEAAFNQISGLSSYSNLPSLLANGIDFLKTNGNVGQLVLIANSDNVASPTIANQLITDVQALMTPKRFAINVLDYTDMNYTYFYTGNQYYKGNDYFYQNITTLTGGNYERTITNTNYYNDTRPFATAALELFVSLDGKISNFDVYSKLQSGYCYGRFSSDMTGLFQLNKTFTQVGRYYGSGPIELEVSGMFEGTPFSETVTINNMHQTDVSTRNMWVGNYIEAMENSYPDNQDIADIIDHSISNRILSRYTAFLALEPNDTLSYCENCEDETTNNPGGNTTDVNDLGEDSVAMRAFPNPFTSQVTISFENLSIEGEVSLQIYNLMGQLVKSIPVEASVNGKFEYVWNGDTNGGEPVSPGIYLLTVSGPNGKQTMKLLKQ